MEGDGNLLSRSEVLLSLKTSDINVVRSGMIEEALPVAAKNGRLPADFISAIERFLKSSLLENRIAALDILAQYSENTHYELDAICILLMGVVHDNDEAVYGAVRSLSKLEERGNERARELVSLLDIDDKWRNEYYPEFPYSK